MWWVDTSNNAGKQGRKPKRREYMQITRSYRVQEVQGVEGGQVVVQAWGWKGTLIHPGCLVCIVLAVVGVEAAAATVASGSGFHSEDGCCIY
jgi:hypothetical protein